MGNITKPRIDSEDMNLFIKTAKHGFVDMYYCYRFYKKDCKKRTIIERINQLAKHKYLHLVRTFVPPEYMATQHEGYVVITLDEKAIQLMRDIGISVEDKRTILSSGSPYRYYHQVQVATVCDVLEDTFKKNNSSFEVKEIFSEKEVFSEDIKHMPDASVLFKLKDDTKTTCIPIFIEVERSYTSVDRLSSKLRRYDLAFSENAYTKILGGNLISPRILFVSQKQGQFTALQKKIEASENSKNLNILLIDYQDLITQSDEMVYYDICSGKVVKLLSQMAN